MTVSARRPLGQNYAWVFAAVRFFSLLAAPGLLRELQGRYPESLVIAGVLGFVAAPGALAIRRKGSGAAPVAA